MKIPSRRRLLQIAGGLILGWFAAAGVRHSCEPSVRVEVRACEEKGHDLFHQNAQLVMDLADCQVRRAQCRCEQPRLEPQEEGRDAE